MKTPTINSRILKLEVLKDTATRASVNAVASRTTSLESDVATAQSDISTLQGNVATLTQGIQDAVSAHNTATDSHADIRTAIAHNADHAALSNVLPSAASQNHLTDDELEFFGTLPSTISDLMSNVEEVDADFVSISYNPSGALSPTLNDSGVGNSLIADASVGTLRTLVSGDGVSISVGENGTLIISAAAAAAALTIAGWSFDFVSLDSGDYEAWTSGTSWASAGGVTAQENISTDPVAYASGGDYYELTGGTGWAGSGTLVQYTL